MIFCIIRLALSICFPILSKNVQPIKLVTPRFEEKEKFLQLNRIAHNPEEFLDQLNQGLKRKMP